MKFDFRNFTRRLTRADWLDLAVRIGATLLLLPFVYLFVGTGYLAGLLAAAIVAFVQWLHDRYLHALSVRINADNAMMWDVEMNGVKVGTITDSDYAALRLRVFTDARNYVAQIGNCGKIVIRAIDYAYLGIPIGAFWIGVMLAVFSPTDFSAIVSWLQKSGTDPVAITAAVKVGAQLFGVLLLVIVGAHWMLGLSRFGFVNRFSEATARAVRVRCGVAAEGELTLVRWADGGPLFNDEMAFIRTDRKG
jgi:hypothetical protein